MLVGSWLIFTVIVWAAYRSSLATYLTVQGTFPPVNSFEDLLDQEGWTWGTWVYAVILRKFLESNPDPVLHRIGQDLQVRITKQQNKNIP